jgi:hypothetical protein
MDLDRVLTLRRASRYANPLNPDAILPRCFGAFTDPTAVPSDPNDGGFTPAVCIDRLNLIYLINDGPVVSIPPEIYFNGILQENPYPAIATFNFANNVEGLGLVATLQFNLSAVLNGEVSVRHAGSSDAQGLPITNPVRGLIWMLVQYLGWTANDFDRGAVEQTIHDMDLLGYYFWWVFQEEKTVREWLLEILPQYHTDATETGNGQLSLILDRSLTTLPVYPDYHVPASEIEDFGVPATAVSSEKQIDDLCNQVTLHGRHHWVTGQTTASFIADFVQSQAAYQAAYPVDFTFRGMYQLAHATTWLNSFFTRHGFEPRVVRFTLRGLKGTTLIPPRFITVEWPPRGWSQRLLKIRKRTTSWARRQVTLECIDCQRELSDTVITPEMALEQRRERIARVYQWIPGTIGDHGAIEDAPGPGKNEAANGDFELGNNGQWDLRGGSAIQRWTIEENAASAFNGRFYARSVAGLNDYSMLTLRRRIDPGEWLMVSGWFRNETSNTDGRGLVIGAFYDSSGNQVQLVLGNPVFATLNYVESVVLAQAPAGSYHFRPGIALFPVPTQGQWRADKITANSGSRGELITKRSNDISATGLLVNADFELGDVNWLKGANWYLDGTLPRSGLYHMTHLGDASGSGQFSQLNSLTRGTLIPGQTLVAHGFWRTVGATTGQVRIGVTWINGQGGVIDTVYTNWLFAPQEGGYLNTSGNVVVPTGVVYAHFFAEVYNHTNGYWLFDDFLAWIQP